MSQAAVFGVPVDILKSGASEEKGERAKLVNIVGACAVADMVKSTLGPKGMDKILQPADRRDGAIIITNDGATILRSVWMDSPAGKVLVDIAKTQDGEVGDGTTSVVVLTGELLREAERLLAQAVHPQVIIDGWHDATAVALRTLSTLSRPLDVSTAATSRASLLRIASTSLSSKVLSFDAVRFAEMAVDAVLRLKGSSELDAIHVVKKLGGSVSDSFLSSGFLLDKHIGVGQPRVLVNPKVLVANTAMDQDKIKIYGARVKVASLKELAAVEAAEKAKMKEKVEKILSHGVHCFVNRQLIYNYPESLFAAAGVMAIEHADFEGVERLAAALGAEVVSTFDAPEGVRVGTCERIDEVMIGEDRMIRFSGLPRGEACTVVLRGPTQHLLDEMERALHDALCVVSQTVLTGRIVPGAGASEVAMSRAVDDAARGVPGKKQLAMEAFGRALRQLPCIIANNAGLDGADLVARVVAEQHTAGKPYAGLDLTTGGVSGDVFELGVVEPLKSKEGVVRYASEAAECILRVDGVIRQPPRARER